MNQPKKQTGAKPRMAELQPRHQFLLNPHAGLRMSLCPTCEKPTFPRKFALLIHIEGWGMITLGKTCKYCSKDELIVCHQDELDAQLAEAFSKLKPEIIGNKYLVLGTVEMKIFKQSLLVPATTAELLAHTADFRGHMDLSFDPGGWRHKDADPAKFIITSEEAEKKRRTPWTAGITTSPPVHQV